jgi:hypothetical protein
MSLTNEEFLKKLDNHPALRTRIEGLFTIIDNPDGRSTRADDAELLVQQELRSLGREMLQEWAADELERSQETLLNSGVTVERKSKKNSTGTQPMEK